MSACLILVLASLSVEVSLRGKDAPDDTETDETSTSQSLSAETFGECEEKVSAIKHRATRFQQKYASCLGPLRRAVSKVKDARKMLEKVAIGADNATQHKHTAQKSAKESIEDLNKAKHERALSQQNCTNLLDMAQAKAGGLKTEAQSQAEAQAAEMAAIDDQLSIRNQQHKQSFITNSRKELQAQLNQLRTETAKIVDHIRTQSESHLEEIHSKQTRLTASSHQQVTDSETKLLKNATGEEQTLLAQELQRVAMAQHQRDQAIQQASALRATISDRNSKLQAEQRALQNVELTANQLRGWSDTHIGHLMRISGTSMDEAEAERVSMMEQSKPDEEDEHHEEQAANAIDVVVAHKLEEKVDLPPSGPSQGDQNDAEDADEEAMSAEDESPSII